jgi:hypothetical protein
LTEIAQRGRRGEVLHCRVCHWGDAGNDDGSRVVSRSFARQYRNRTAAPGGFARSSFGHPYQAGREFRLARDRGPAVTGHHMRIFGSNYDHWDLYWKKIRKQEPPPLSGPAEDRHRHSCAGDASARPNTTNSPIGMMGTVSLAWTNCGKEFKRRPSDETPPR